MKNELNPSLSNQKVDKFQIADLSTNKNFGKLNPDIQHEIINIVDNTKEKEGGLIGKLVGIKPANAAINIAFVTCSILLFLLCLLPFINDIDLKKDLSHAIIPAITLILGYVFGKSN